MPVYKYSHEFGALLLHCTFWEPKFTVTDIGFRVAERNRIRAPLSGFALPLMLAAALLASCANAPPAAAPTALSAAEARALIERSVPAGVSDKAGWIQDIDDAFSVQKIQVNRENVCAVVAVIAQESSFQVNPTVPGLPAIAWREIDKRAKHAGVPLLLVHGALKLSSGGGRSYAERIDSARTEKDLSDIFEDFIAAVPLGQQLFADHNPIRTRGPMQVNVAFAREYSAVRPYPYSVKGGIADELFTRRGSLYFGIAHLFAYSAPYDDYLYRFADFNAGQFASRNAAFQSALSRSTGLRLVTDGALLPHDGSTKSAGNTEVAARQLGKRWDLGDSAVHEALELAKSPDLERTVLYQRTFALADRLAGRPLPRALVPQIELTGPKLAHRLSTDWYAHRVDARFKQCLGR
jgi:hypothetical protein